MRKILCIIYAAVIAAFCISADELPELYVMGSCNGWSATDSYKFTHDAEGNYSITLPSLEGEFKIASHNWCYDIGSIEGKGNKSVITLNHTYQTAWAGGNWTAEGLTDVTLSFRIDPNDIKQTFTLTVTDPSGVVTPRPIAGLSGSLPVLYINVYTDENHSTYNNEVISKDLDHKNYFSYAQYHLDINGCQWLMELGGQSVGSNDEWLPMEIKARGNWTRKGFAKKPFKIKLGKKQSLLGMTKSKHYALMAHADDTYGYLRNFTGFNLGLRIGLPWTPVQQPVEVVINGDYRGLYFLTESIRVGDDRVMIDELADIESNPSLISGGYIVELDNYDEDNQIRLDERSCAPGYHLDKLRITWDTPEQYSDIQRQFVTDQFTAINEYIGANSDNTWSHLDLDDAVRYYIVEEIVSHTEAYHGSTYLFRDSGEGEKWHFSPLWDFGNAFNGRTDMFFYDNTLFGNTWIPSMRRNDMFNDKLHATWLWFMQHQYDGLEDEIEQICDRLKLAAQADYDRWYDAPLPSLSGSTSVADNRDMNSRKQQVLEHLHAKINWLKTQFGDYNAVDPVDEPSRDDTPAAPLPDYITSIDEIISDDNTVTPEYYDIVGRRLTTLQAGTFIIEHRGTTATKRYFLP